MMEPHLGSVASSRWTRSATHLAATSWSNRANHFFHTMCSLTCKFGRTTKRTREILAHVQALFRRDPSDIEAIPENEPHNFWCCPHLLFTTARALACWVAEILGADAGIFAMQARLSGKRQSVDSTRTSHTSSRRRPGFGNTHAIWKNTHQVSRKNSQQHAER